MWQAAAVVVAAIIGSGLSAYAVVSVSRRTHSGHIDSTEAHDLWQSILKFTENQDAQIVRLGQQVTTIQADRDRLQVELAVQGVKIVRLEDETTRLEEANERCEKRVTALTVQLAELRDKK